MVTNIESTLSWQSMWFTVLRHSFVEMPLIPVARSSVRLTAMKIEAGTPLPETSAMTNPTRLSSILKKSKKSPPTSFAGVMVA